MKEIKVECNLKGDMNEKKKNINLSNISFLPQLINFINNSYFI